MKLIKLLLKNFQGVKNLEIDINGEDYWIGGKNESGKTTIANSYCWLLTGKPYTNEKDYNPQTISGNELMHNLEHGVKAEILREDGSTLILERIYKEIWTKKRGRSEAELTGGTTDYAIDGVPATASEYEEYISSEIGSSEQIQMLIKPEFFADSLDWKRRRELVMELTEELSVDQVISENNDLVDLPKFLLKPGTTDSYYSIDELTKIAVAEKKNLKKELDEIPSRIDEVNRMAPTPLDETEIEKINLFIKAASDEYAKIEKELQDLEVVEDNQVVRKQIAELITQSVELENQIINQNTKTKADFENLLYQAQSKLSHAELAFQSQKTKTEESQDKLDRIEVTRAEIKQQYIELNQKELDFNPTTTCEFCGQKLPEKDIEELVANYKEKISIQKEKLIEKGKNEFSKSILAASQADLAKAEAELKLAAEDVDFAKEKLAEIQQVKPIEKSVQDNKEYQSIVSKIKELENNANSQKISEEKETRKREIAFRKNELMSIIDSHKGTLRSQADAVKYQERIAELEANLKQAGKNYEQAEYKLYLIELFVKTKADLLTSKINSKFRNLKFKLFDIQKNGGINPTCEVLIPSNTGDLIEFKSANNAGRINAGLEVISTFSEHWDINLPVFIDNAESINQLKEIANQIIALYVTPNKLTFRTMKEAGEQVSLFG